MARPEHIQALLEMSEPLWPEFAAMAPQGTRTRLLFVAPHAGAGTTTLSLATGLGLATNLRRPVMVVELNLRRPGLAKLLGTAESPGLTEVFEGKARIEQAIHAPPGTEFLRILPAGAARAPRPGEFAPDTLWAAFSSAANAAQFVILDAPPLLEETAARSLFSNVDGAVLVVQARKTVKRDAQKAVRMLQRAGVRIMGTLVNRYVNDLLFNVSA